MQPLDRQVLQQALSWCLEGQTVWLCTVLATYGSSPRPLGALLVARADGRYCGSLSGGCVEEDFIGRLVEGEFTDAIRIHRYGDNVDDRQRLRLPCGGMLEVLIEKLAPCNATEAMLGELLAALDGRQILMRELDLVTGHYKVLTADRPGPAVEHLESLVRLRYGPSRRLLIAGISPVSVYCAEFARALGFEVIVCDPREEVRATFDVDGVEVVPLLPSLYIAGGGCHRATAVVALTHDPRIDDLAMMEAVRTEAFYIGVMGSQRTSKARAERLLRSGGLREDQIERIRMPVGLPIGSKTPAEIALAVMADIVQVHNSSQSVQV